MKSPSESSEIVIHPLAPERFGDFERLFGPRGACGGCWCMWFRLKRSDFEKNKGAGNRRAMRAIVRSGEAPGLLAYAGGEPVGWCAVAPRDRYVLLQRSRILKPVDDQPVWSVVCFFIAKAWRGKGITSRLLEAAKAHAAAHGASILEGYPVEPQNRRIPEVFAFYGLASAFRRAGFAECARRSASRPIMRCELAAGASGSRGRHDPAGDKVLCRTPAPGKQGVRIDAWKFDLVRGAILDAVPRGLKSVSFKDLPALVQARIPAAERRQLGSIAWYTVCVKLELEVRGEIERVPGSGPQRLRRA